MPGRTGRRSADECGIQARRDGDQRGEHADHYGEVEREGDRRPAEHEVAERVDHMLSGFARAIICNQRGIMSSG